jgi:NAD(P)-dependent dehydrogenase (short-subunit alcohol dehydrogenase family)
MSADLSGRVAVVSGASRGVGHAIAVALGDSGAEVVGLSRRPCSVGWHVPTNVSRLDDVERARRLIEEKFGPASILVNAAGSYGPLRLVQDSDPQEWIDVLMVNTVGTYLTCHAFVPGMIELGWGRIVNITSAASLHSPGALNSAYATSKVAVNQLTRHLAAELAGTGVTANVLHPGDLKTDIWSDIRRRLETVGPLGDPYRSWVSWVEETGGDSPDKPAKAVLDIISGSGNGIFHWIDNPLQAPIPSWSTEVVPLDWEGASELAHEGGLRSALRHQLAS